MTGPLFWSVRTSRRELADLAGWCRRQAAEPGADPLWLRLAVEIESYLDPAVDDAAPVGQGGLFDD